MIRAPLYAQHWHLYALVCEMEAGEFVVKIGVSSDPFSRYAAMLPAVPFKSVMLYAEVGVKERAYELEKALHRYFQDRRSKGEWFRFSLSEKQQFHQAIARQYQYTTGKQLRWERIHPQQVWRYTAEKRARQQRFREFAYGR